MHKQLIYGILKFRLKQIGRTCRQAGWFAASMLSLFLILFLIGLIDWPPEHAYLILLLYLLLSIPFQLSRKDHPYLRKLAVSRTLIFQAEYNALVLPITLIMVWQLQFGLILAGHALVSAVAFLPSRHRRHDQKTDQLMIAWVPEKLFEWRTFFRKHRFLWPVIYLLTLLLASHIFIVPLGLLVLLGAFPEVYQPLESKEIIQTYPRETPFLRAKICDHSLFIHLLFSPLYVIFILWHAHLWYVLTVMIIFIELNIIFGLVYKYARWANDTNSAHNNLPFLVFYVTLIFFFPLSIFFIYRYWKRAQKAVYPYA